MVQALGAEIEMIMRFNESPEPTPPGMLQAGFEDKVRHASFHVGEEAQCDPLGVFFARSSQFFSSHLHSSYTCSYI